MDKKLRISADDGAKDVQKDFKFEIPADAIVGTAMKNPIFSGKIGINHGSGFRLEVADGEVKFSCADDKDMNIELDHSLVKAGNTPGTEDETVTLTALDADSGALVTVRGYTEKKTNAHLTVKDHDFVQDLIRVLDQEIQFVFTACSNLGAV